MQNASKAEVEKWWNSLSDEDKKYLLQGKGDDSMPLAEQLMKLRDKLPEGDLARIRNELLEQGKKRSRSIKTKNPSVLKARLPGLPVGHT